MIDLTKLPTLPAHPIVLKAVRFARIAHGEQVRKYTGELYYNHPIEVARIFLELYDGEEVIDGVVAAILHDTVEDTATTLDDIHYFFGGYVAHIVDGLTDVSKPEDGNRVTRKAMDRIHTHATDALTKSVKCCDLISNTFSIVEEAPGFAKIYLPEKMALLAGMREADFGCHSEAVLVAGLGLKKLGVET